jgi:hypothetical protein
MVPSIPSKEIAPSSHRDLCQVIEGMELRGSRRCGEGTRNSAAVGSERSSCRSNLPYRRKLTNSCRDQNRATTTLKSQERRKRCSTVVCCRTLKNVESGTVANAIIATFCGERGQTVSPCLTLGREDVGASGQRKRPAKQLGRQIPGAP